MEENADIEDNGDKDDYEDFDNIAENHEDENKEKVDYTILYRMGSYIT